MSFLFMACSLQDLAAHSSPPRTLDVACDEHTSREFWVVNLGWHTGVIVRRADLDSEMQARIDPISSLPFIEFGWGDRDFYMSADYSWLEALRAGFASARSVVHIATFSDEDFARHLENNEVVHVRTSSEGSRRMLAFIFSSMAPDDTALLPCLGPSLYGKGCFVAAKGSFSFSYTCNSWAADAVKTAGCPIDPSLARASTLTRRLSHVPPKAEHQDFAM